LGNILGSYCAILYICLSTKLNHIMKNLQKLNRNKLKGIKGGNTTDIGYCPDSQTYIPCDELCPNKRNPLCAIQA